MSDVVAGILLLLALLIAAFFSLQLVTTIARFGKISADWDIRCVTTATLLSILMVIVVEALSVLQLLSAFGLAAAWIIASVLLHQARQNIEKKLPAESATPAPPSIQSTGWTAEERSLRHGIAWTLAGLFALAFFTAPTILDPLTLDLTRALHWIQNGSVAHFTTHDLRQLQSPPFPAFALLHAYLFSSGDQLAHLVPWAALLLTLVAISALTAQLAPRLSPGASSSRKARLWSSTLALCLLLVLNAAFPNSANFVGALWIVSLALFGLLLISSPGNIVYALGLGASLALSILSNGNLALPALILAIVLLFVSIKHAAATRLRIVAVFAITAVAFVAPHYLRNLQLFGAPAPVLWSAFPSQLTLVILLVPFLASIIARKFINPAKIALAALLVPVALCSIFLNPVRPILDADFLFQSRERQRFHGASDLYELAARAVNDIFISGSTNVALHIQSPAEALAKINYPIWAIFTDNGFERPVYHIGATNVTARLAFPPPIQALLTSSSNTQISDYKLIYGPIAAYWTELDSRWVQLSELQPVKRILSSTNQELFEFNENSTTILSSRVGRQGVLTIDCAYGDPQGLLRTPTTLSVKTPAGFTTTSRSTNSFHIVEIPVPQGQTEIRLSPAFKPPADTVLALRSWSWYPTEQPLPFIYISKITSPTTSLEPNTLVIGPNSDLAIQLVSGAIGVVDLQFLALRTDDTPLQISTAAFRTNVIFRTNAAVARVPVQRGTNQFTVTNPSTNTLLLDRIEPRFRDFVE